MTESDELILRGSPISNGIGMGLPIFFSGIEESDSIEQTSFHGVDEQIARYREALDLSRKDLESLQQKSLNNGPSEVSAILGTHLEIIKDPLITEEVETKIRDTKQSMEAIFHHLIEEYKGHFRAVKDSYFQERVRDIVDISRRILGHLKPYGRLRISDVPHNSIVLAHELVPSETIEANTSLVSAFVTETGGLTSHAAIIARAKGIPYVANIDLKALKGISIHTLIVDGTTGLVIVNPKKETLKKYQELRRDYKRSYEQLKNTRNLKPETIDGCEVRIFANLENPDEIDLLEKNGAAGVGLFRSEYLCMVKKGFPSEEEQFEIYKKMVKSLKGRPLVVRIYDIGGDKKMEIPSDCPDARYFSKIGHESNPALGCRAIRFLLKFPEILKAQLRAILRASKFGEIHILVPMVSDVQELRLVRQTVDQLKITLEKEGLIFAKEIPIGCMIEVPSSALMCDAIAQEADFLSIGTNDLIQYILAADRTNPNTADLYYATHPSALRLIRMVVTSANEAKKPVILCGEAATDPLLIPVLLGFGIFEFSVASRHIPIVKNTIRKWRLIEACRLAEGALIPTSAKSLKEYLLKEAIR